MHATYLIGVGFDTTPNKPTVYKQGPQRTFSKRAPENAHHAFIEWT